MYVEYLMRLCHYFSNCTDQGGLSVVHGGGDSPKLVMFIVDDVVEEDRRLLASELGSTILQNRSSLSLNLASRDVYVIIQDLCLLQNGERTQILQLEHHNTFAL
jgi:hypothetical protein